MSGTNEGTRSSATSPRSRINPLVFYGSSICILAITALAMIWPGVTGKAIGAIVGWISEGFGWYYFLAATIFLGFVIFIAASRYGRTRLGPEHSRPDFSLFTWTAMLFSAGIGTDLMFYSVAEPVSQYLEPPIGQGESVQAARDAVVWTLFHYGITGWAMYALMGMAFGYFAYRHRLPLSIRSALYPIFGRRIQGKIGDIIDIAAVLGTIFGIATSLGIGVVQLNYGIKFLFGIPEGTAAQIGLIVVAVVMATVSVVSGVNRGIRRLSEINVVLAIGLMLFLLASGQTIFLLNGIVLNVGDYVSGFADLTLNTFAFDRPTEWLNLWTLFFWAWWIAWAPFVGLFLARISRGRTIRQFVAATLVVPFLFILLWISIFGNSALDIVRGGNERFGEVAKDHGERAFYSLLEQYPAVPVAAGVATLIGLLFYVTSADSGALVLSNFTSHLKDARSDGQPWVRIFWAIVTGLLTLAMLIVGGVVTLQNATIVMGLPFSFVMFLVMLGLYRALRVERFRADSFRTTLPSSLSERVFAAGQPARRSWRRRLARTMNYPTRADTARFIDEICRPVLSEVAEELRSQYVDATVADDSAEGELGRPSLVVNFGEDPRFVYAILPVESPTPAFAVRSMSSADSYFRVEVRLAEGGQGYDVMGYGREQLIGDVLDQYERHLEFIRLANGVPGQTLSGQDPTADDDGAADRPQDG